MSPSEPDGPALDIAVLPVEAVVETVSGRRRLELRCSRAVSGVPVSGRAALRLRVGGRAADGVVVVGATGSHAAAGTEFELVVAEPICGVVGVVLLSSARSLAVVERVIRWRWLGGIC